MHYTLTVLNQLQGEIENRLHDIEAGIEGEKKLGDARNFGTAKAP